MLRAAKASASSPHPALCLPVGSPVTALLRPVVTRPGAIAPGDLSALTEWRNRFVSSFLSEFQADEQRTERWLVQSVGPDDTRILFMVEDPARRTIGYIGLAFIDWDAGRAEADAVVRGAEAPPGLFARALATMWSWGRNALGLSTLGVRVRSDNAALAFYYKAGFRETRRVPLRREERPDEVRWVEDPSLPPGGLSLVHMSLEQDDT